MRDDCRRRNRNSRPSDSQGGRPLRRPQQVRDETGWARIPSQPVPSCSSILVSQPGLSLTSSISPPAGEGSMAGFGTLRYSTYITPPYTLRTLLIRRNQCLELL